MSIERLQQLRARAHAAQRGSVRIPLADLDRALRSIEWLERRHAEQLEEYEHMLKKNARLGRELNTERMAFAKAAAAFWDTNNNGVIDNQAELDTYTRLKEEE